MSTLKYKTKPAVKIYFLTANVSFNFSLLSKGILLFLQNRETESYTVH